MSDLAQAFCFDEAGKEFDVNPKLLRAVCYTESRLNPKAVNDKNPDETIDLGLCQINSWWYPKLLKLGITEEDLLTDACLNTRVSAWILAQNFETSGETWLSIGAYNAGYKKTEQKDRAREKYIALVKENLVVMP